MSSLRLQFKKKKYSKKTFLGSAQVTMLKVELCWFARVCVESIPKFVLYLMLTFVLFVAASVSVSAVQCPMCHGMYKNLNSLKAHISQLCGKTTDFQCQFCKYKCKRKYCLKKHLIGRHADELQKSGNKHLLD